MVSLDDSPAYDALSYVWGSEDDPATITVNHCPFRITRNLHTALGNMLPSDNSARSLWVDAICINQGHSPEDLEERSNQVMLMSLIFRGAVSVTAFLGDPFPGLKLAMKYLALAAEAPHRHIDLDRFPHLGVSGKATGSNQLRDALFRLLDQQWWGRIWTVQEYVLGHDVVFQVGRSRYPADMVSDGVESLLQHGNTGGCCASVAFNMAPDGSEYNVWAAISRFFWVADARRSRTRISLSHGLTNLNDRRCGDPRDKIYALLGLFTGFEDVIRPDYKKPPEELFRDFALAWTRKERNLRFLSYIVRPHNRPGLPTWAVDWSLNPYPSLGLDFAFRARSDCQTRGLFDACVGTRPIWCLDPPDVVVANGFLYDTITVGPTVPRLSDVPLWNPKERCEWLGCVLETALATGSAYGSFERAQRALLRTLCGDMRRDEYGVWRRNKAADYEDVEQRLKTWWEEASCPQNANNYATHRELGGEVHSAVENATLGRRFVTTAKGYIGLATRESRAGDVVAILGGGAVPFILRPMPSVPAAQAVLGLTDGLFFQVIGDAYVHGIMDGEAFSICGKNKDDLGRLFLV